MSISMTDLAERIAKLEANAVRPGKDWIILGDKMIAWGATQASGPANDDGGARGITVTFSRPFSEPPIFVPSVQANAQGSGSIGGIYSYNLGNITPSQASFWIRYSPNADQGALPLFYSWIAIGPAKL